MRSLPLLSKMLLLSLMIPSVGCGTANKPGSGKTGTDSAGDGGGAKPKVAFVSNNTHEFWNIVEKGFNAGAKEGNADPVFQRPQDGTPAGQKKIIDALVARGVKAISISVIDPENQTDYLNSVAKKTPLLAVDNDAEKSNRLCYIGTDNVKAGRAVGKLIKEAMPAGGKIGLFVGQIEPLNARQRIQGVLEELDIPIEKLGTASATRSKDGKYELVRKEAYTDDTKQNVARENAAIALTKYAGDDLCLVGLWAYNPPAILNAVKEAKREGKVKIIGFDENNETLQGIEEGTIYGTVVQNPYMFGKRAAEVMAKIARGEDPKLPKDGKENIEERIITKQGGAGRLKVNNFKAELDQLTK